jgi:hypothetical protein
LAEPITAMSASQPDPPQQAPIDPGQIPLSPDDLAMWRGLITKSREARKKVATWWDANLKTYAPDASASPEDYGTQLNTNRDFTLVERKKADLFYQRPDVTVVPSPLFAGQEALLETHQAILNESLGPDGVNATAMVHQVLFDVLCTAGTGFTLMGYESATVPTPVLRQETGQIEISPVPIYENVFWEPFSPWQSLLPHDLKSTDYDRAAAWMGMEFEIPVRSAKRKGWVGEDYKGSAPDKDLHHDNGATTGGEAVCHGVLIFYKSALFRDDRVHPLHMTKLVLIEGAESAAEHMDSPYQTLDAQGKLTPDSLIGFPIHPLTIRTLTDSQYVPSDCTMSRPIVNELNTFRRQMVEQRDANILRWIYNVDTLPTDALGKIVRSPIGGFIGVPGDAFVGDGAIKELPHGTYPRENFAFNDYLDGDLARTHALDANQQGVSTEGEGTATEAQIQQENVNARLGFERGKALNWFADQGCTKYSTLLMRFLSTADAAAIVGPDAAKLWDSWRKAVPARLAFTCLPDSSLRTDVAVERKRVRDDYTFFANDPFINRMEFLKESMPKMGYSLRVINQEPPEKGPEPTKPGLSFKGDDLNPLNPQFALVVEAMAQCGIVFSQKAIAEAQGAASNQILMQQAQVANAEANGEKPKDTGHGGKVAQMEGLSKHATDLTGGMQGSGAVTPMGAGGIQ